MTDRAREAFLELKDGNKWGNNSSNGVTSIQEYLINFQGV